MQSDVDIDGKNAGSSLDYSELDLAAGLEIHQQLDTGKLFCRCPSLMRDDAPDFTVKRFLRASAGEMGGIDAAAASEMEKRKHYIYEAYEDTTCLVELDEAPPLPMDADALRIVLQLAMMTGADMVDEIHVMRKTVVDGSNTSGFQRTALVARNGAIDVDVDSKHSVHVAIDSLCIEEDAAKIVERGSDHDIYRLDRLGIPLVEIATGPDMHTPQEARAVAGFIGMMLRSTGRVKRGLGTIRQDVNVSIKTGARVEIKGVQDLRILDKVVELEALRQHNMLRLREEMKAKGITVESLTHDPRMLHVDYTTGFLGLGKGFIKAGIDSGLKVYGKSYPLFKGFFGYEINPGRRFGTELSDHIKVLGLNGLIHTDENLEKYGIFDIVQDIRASSRLGQEDAMIFILGSDEKCDTAFAKINETIITLLANGLSKEVRNARDDGTSSFMRPMPGSSRMYPETDVKTIIPDTSGIAMPELIADKAARLSREYGLPLQVAKELVLEPLFEILVKRYPQLKPVTIAETLVTYPVEIKTLYGREIDAQLYADALLLRANSGSIDASAIKSCLLDIANGSSLNDAILKYSVADEDDVASFITRTISEKPGLNSNAIMGIVMKEYRGRFSGKRILELIKRFKGD